MGGISTRVSPTQLVGQSWGLYVAGRTTAGGSEAEVVPVGLGDGEGCLPVWPWLSSGLALSPAPPSGLRSTNSQLGQAMWGRV